VARIEDTIGITYRQLDHWCKAEYLRPEGGNGVQRSWPEQEIKIGRMMARLVAIGMKPERAAFYARQAVVERVPMTLEFRDGKLRVRGHFSRAIRSHLDRQQQVRDARKYTPLDSSEKAC
jgi:hypothetical protein